MKCPCKDCTKRNATCHGSCVDFRTWSEWHQKQHMMEREDHKFTEEKRHGAELIMWERKWK